MGSERFAQVRELFDRVIELPESKREPCLRTLTQDADLIADVLKICRSTDRSSTTRFAQPLSAILNSAALPAPQIGDTIGAWRIVSVIGQGGMGTVYRAQRNDGHFEQEAALKLLHGIPGASSLEYLSRERQILATLSHPNIARLYDGGATPGGQPYLVMEYIEGIAIDRYCLDHRISANDVLQLVVDLCGAIGFAHQRLIVHCDIKPSNILVTPTGRPMLLDFGIARLLDGRATQASVLEEADAGEGGSKNPANTLSRAFTPQYASPEQRTGDVLTTATDVYGLGGMLRELLETSSLAGRDGRGGAAPRLNDELQALINTATHDDPAKRYVSAGAMAADIERYLQRRPLKAANATPAYVALKFSQRNWPWLAAAAVFMLTTSLAAFRIVSERDRAQSAEQQALLERDATRLARADALRERDRAQSAESTAVEQRDNARMSEAKAVEEKNRATQAEVKAVAERNRAAQAEASTRQTSDFLISIFDSSNPNAESGDIPASKLIAAAETRLDTQMKGQPETQALLYNALATVQSNMGNTRQANENYKRALELERKQDRPLVLAQMLNRIASLRGANFGIAEAEPYAREALTLREKHSRPDSEELAESLTTLGNILTAQGKKSESGELLARAMAIREKADPAGRGVASSLHFLAMNSLRFENHDGAIAQFQKSLAIRAALVGEGHPDYLATQEEYGNALNMARRYPEAEVVMKRALEQRRKLHGSDNEKVAFGLNVLGSVVNRQGRSLEAIVLYREALGIVGQKFGKRSMPYASVLNNLAIPQQNLGDLEAAEGTYSEAMTIFESIWPETDLTLARVRYNVARIRIQMLQPERAEAPLQKAYAARLKALGDKHGDVIETRVVLADWHLARGEVATTASLIKDISPSMPVKDLFTVIAYERLSARVAAAQGRHDEARQLFGKADEMSVNAFGENDRRTWLGKLDRAEWLLATGVAQNRVEGTELAEKILAALGPMLAQQGMLRTRIERAAGKGRN